MKKFLRFARLFLLPQWRLFLLAMLTGLVAAAASGMGLPFMIWAVFPVIFQGTDTLPASIAPYVADWDSHHILLLACSMMPLIFIIRGIAMWGNAMVVNILSLRILQDLRLTFFSRILDLPLSYSESQQKGDLMSRLTADTQNVQLVISRVSNDIIKQPITAIAALSAFFLLVMQQGADWSFIVNILFVVLAIYPVVVFGKRIAKRSHLIQSDMGEMTSILQQNIESQREVRAYSLEQRQTDDFEERGSKYERNYVKMVKYQVAITPIMETITALALAFLLAKGKLSGMTLSDFLALAAALYMGFDAMKRAARSINSLNQAQGALQRLSDILDAPNDITDPVQPKHWHGVRGDIRFDNVSFSYQQGGHKALRNINLHIPAGQIVGLVGASGAGKSTFASLLPRFYDVDSGSISLDDIDIREVTQEELRANIALVGQHALLFEGSIRDNIALGKPFASDKQIQSAADAASVTSFLDSQAEGLDTELGQGGLGLSGGQRQRVALARAFAKDAPILILDEATASLDAKGEREIQQSLEALCAGRTTLIVAHRFSTLQHAHRLLVFDQGEIIADGSHEELYEGCEVYKELYDKQSIEELR